MATTCTVTATLNTAAAADLQGNSFVRFRLRNFSGYVPRVNGTAIVAEPVIDALPNSSGGISTTLWGNDNIVPLNTLTSPQYNGTFYTVEFWNAGRITSSGNYIITGSSFDLDTAAQMSTPAQTATGGSGNTSPILQVNGTNNAVQTKLNLKDSATITWTDNGDGSVSANIVPPS